MSRMDSTKNHQEQIRYPSLLYALFDGLSSWRPITLYGMKVLLGLEIAVTGQQSTQESFQLLTIS